MGSRVNSLFSFFMVFAASFLLVISTITPAEAKRFGSGSSFGSKFSQSNSVKKSTNKPVQKQAATPAQQQNAQQKQQLASKGGMMGILGGLAIGGLLGAMFFGGAFENINFMDILIFALIGFILFKIFTSRRRSHQAATPQGPVSQEFSVEPQQQSGGSADTAPTARSDTSFGGISLDDLRGDISRDFDKESFIEGAKSCYARLQNAWDEGDLADIRQFTTDHVFAEIQDQLRGRETNSETKIVALNAELMSVQQLGGGMEATVLFETRLSEDGQENSISEVWHFTRPAGSLTPTWYLDGIQQVEE